MTQSIEPMLRLLYYIPEGIVIGTAALTYVGLRPPLKRIILFGVVYGFTIFICRDLFLPAINLGPGFHTIILFVFNALFLKVLFHLTIPGSLICSFLYFLTLFIIEPLTFSFLKLFSISPADVLSSPWNFILSGWFNLGLVLAGVYIIRKKNFLLLPITQIIKDEKHG